MTPFHFDCLSHAISSAGSPVFYDALLAALQAFAPVAQLRARLFHQEDGLQLLGSAGEAAVKPPAEDAETAALPALFDKARERQVILRSLPSARGRVEVAFGVGYAWRHGDSLFLLDLLRPTKLGPFAAEDVQRLSDAGRLVASIVGVHATRHRIDIAVRSNRRDDIAEQVVRFLGAGLTRREAEVVSRIVMGMRTDAIASELGIKAATVITFRKRAYAKLGVGRQAELFARCVQMFSDLNPPPPAVVH